MANIKEIAKRAGVSSATVSRVINNNGYVSKETKAKVAQIVKELDYVPNRNAVSLKKGATKLIGIVAPLFSDSLNVFLKSFTIAAQAKNYNVTLFVTGLDKSKEMEALEMLRRKQLDGLVLAIRLNDWDVIEHYTKYGPIVTWQRIENSSVASVFMNQYDGYMLGLEHLYAQGYRRIMNVYGNINGLNTKSRMDAYEDFCVKYDLDSRLFPHIHSQAHRKDGEKLAHWWKAQAGVKPDAFITSADFFAAGLVTEARRLGITVPDDFAVCGFDNMDVAHLLDITTIHYPVDKQGENAFTIINNYLNKESTPLLELDFHLVVRKTT